MADNFPTHVDFKPLIHLPSYEISFYLEHAYYSEEINDDYDWYINEYASRN